MSRLFSKRQRTDWIVAHCSATPPTLNIGAKDIDKWHRDKGWSAIGYAFVIRRDGTIEEGRPHWAVGAHVEGFNANSVGFCLVGGVDAKGNPEDNFTPAQYTAMATLLDKLTALYPQAKFRGHRDFPKVAKACPCFDFPKWINEVYLMKDQVEDLTDEPVVEISSALPTIWAISRHFEIPVQDILKANPGIDTKNLQVGQVIKLPS